MSGLVARRICVIRFDGADRERSSAEGRSTFQANLHQSASRADGSATGRSISALHRMSAPTTRYRPGLHVHVYLWTALVTVSVLPFFVASRELYDANQVPERLVAFVLMVVTFQWLLWRARSRCGTDNFGVWDGWLYVAGSMTVGVGYMSLLVAVSSTAVAVVATAGFALASIFEHDVTKAQCRFRRLISWFVRNQMYQ
jgi:hypothetical protein